MLLFIILNLKGKEIGGKQIGFGNIGQLIIGLFDSSKFIIYFLSRAFLYISIINSKSSLYLSFSLSLIKSASTYSNKSVYDFISNNFLFIS